MVKGLNLRYDDLSVKYYHDQIVENFLTFLSDSFSQISGYEFNRAEQLPSWLFDVYRSYFEDDSHRYMIGGLAIAGGHLGKRITVLEFYNMQHEVWKFADELAKFEGRLTSTPSEKRTLWRKIKKELKIKRNITKITRNQYCHVLYRIDAERMLLARKRKKYPQKNVHIKNLRKRIIKNNEKG